MSTRVNCSARTLLHRCAATAALHLMAGCISTPAVEGPLQRSNGIEAVLAYPPFDAFFACSEHFAGQFLVLGDALGADCTVHRLEEIDGRLFSRAYRNLGAENEDWYGWNQPILAACAGVVAGLHLNAVVNSPGRLGRPPASSITLRCDDATHYLYAHIQSPRFKLGDRVNAGEVIAAVGNNGFGRAPHLHVAAWRNNTPLQIRWDQTKMKLPPEFRRGG